ncbi:hypothetical protein [Niallia sp. 03133]|uniref:hypothetical protein n=1 Tax=Niallia sp. 03133 TaxID=3458060 RepID=UPI0040450F9B
MLRGTGILIKKDLSVSFFENIDAATFQNLQTKKNTDKENNNHNNTCKSYSNEPAFWLNKEIDWEYGY